MKFFKKFKARLLKIIGYKYVLNINTGEVHDLDNLTNRCQVGRIADKNKKYLTKKQFQKSINCVINNKRVNGCRYCIPKSDNDNNFKK